MPELTDADQAAILEASGYDRLTDRGQILYEAIYRAGMAAMAERYAPVIEAADALRFTTTSNLHAKAQYDTARAKLKLVK
jgi:hypothetical protein